MQTRPRAAALTKMGIIAKHSGDYSAKWNFASPSRLGVPNHTPYKGSIALRCTLDPWGFRTAPTTSLLIEAGLPPAHLLFNHARLRYALRIECAQPTTNTAATALPHSFPTAIQWCDPFTGRHTVPYPMTRSWNSEPTRAWGRPPLHIDNLASLLRPWSEHAFPVRGLWVSPARLASPHCQSKPARTLPGLPPPPI